MRVVKRLAFLMALLLLPAAAAQGSGVTVAVLDTGVDDDHAELAGKVTRMSFVQVVGLPGPDLPPGVGDEIDPGQVQEDPDGQGTAVASLIAGTTLGLAPEAAILDLQVSAPYTGSELDPAAEEAAIAAMDWLLGQDDPPAVVVLGFAVAGISPGGTATLAQQAHGLWQRGVVVVVPASEPYLALHNSPFVITVAGLDGANAQDAAAPAGLTKPDLSAASVGLEVAQPGTAPGDSPTTTASGSHLGAAQVAAAAALMREARPLLPVPAVVAILHDTAIDVGAAGFDSRTGFGGLQVGDAVAAAGVWQDPVPLDAEEIERRDTPLPLLPVLAALAVALFVARRRVW